MKRFFIVFFPFLMACAGEFQYFPPTISPPIQNSIIINKNKEEAWKDIIPALGESFFVINNLDKESGFINLSYSGDSERYIDCGRIYSYVKNAQGERIYNFPASAAHKKYEMMDMKHGASLSFYDRYMDLEGRINIIVKEISSEACQITVNVKYVLSKSIIASDNQGKSIRNADTISFVSGQQNRFPGTSTFTGTLCQSNGKLESEILSILNAGNPKSIPSTPPPSP